MEYLPSLALRREDRKNLIIMFFNKIKENSLIVLSQELKDLSQLKMYLNDYECIYIESYYKPKNINDAQVFAKEKKGFKIPINIRLLAAVTLIPLLFILYLSVSNNKRSKYLLELQQEMNNLQSIGVELIGINENIKSLENQLSYLEENSPPNIAILFSGLYQVMGNDVVIENFLLKGRSFQIEAIGDNPLSLIKKYENTKGFKDVKINKIVPITGTNKERFSLSGYYDNE